ncbi:MAG: proton-conducting membrane transporter [Lachnospiraceae bacterium]|nr:proton-conducting membrane transporter [Lachnospiraceae bacterium]
MNEFLKNLITILPIVFPIVAGVAMSSVKRKGEHVHSFSKVKLITFSCIEFVLSVLTVLFGSEKTVLFAFTDLISAVLKKDLISTIYILMISGIFLLTGIFAADYMRHDDLKEEEEQKVKTLSGRTFLGFYLIVWGVLIGLAQAGNLVTFYMFYELMTVTSVVLVIHDMTREAVFAAKKYIYYSIAGASLALFGFAFLANTTGAGLDFVSGGSLGSLSYGDRNMVLVSVFLICLGFGAKAGMFPLHGWLPTAHPVAPAPASAVLSGIICKAGVLGILRVLYFIAGPDLVKGTWVQYALITLSLITVFMGSMLAYKENVFKKRLAYSTVSQVSYILFGLACLNPIAFFGALLHTIFHACLKCTLFLNAGAVIYSTDKHKCDELCGIGRALPITLLTFTTASLGLVGIPPVCGFVSKWYLCLGALDLHEKAIGYVGVAILLISALLTAGYLFSIVIAGFFPGADFKDFEDNLEKEKKVKTGMIAVMVVLAVLSVALGVFAKGLYDLIFDTIYAMF